jgi:hypothetical protein
MNEPKGMGLYSSLHRSPFFIVIHLWLITKRKEHYPLFLHLYDVKAPFFIVIHLWFITKRKEHYPLFLHLDDVKDNNILPPRAQIAVRGGRPRHASLMCVLPCVRRGLELRGLAGSGRGQRGGIGRRVLRAATAGVMLPP